MVLVFETRKQYNPVQPSQISRVLVVVEVYDFSILLQEGAENREPIHKTKSKKPLSVKILVYQFPRKFFLL